MNSGQLWFILYLLAVAGITLIHEPWILALLTVVTLVLAGPDRTALIRQALLAILFINVTITVGYIALAYWHGDPWLSVVLRLNLRVFLLTFLTLWVARRIDLVKVLGMTRSLQFLLVITVSQIRVLRSVLADYRLALQSRTPGRPRLRHWYANGGQQAATLMEKGAEQSEEMVQGMRSRGVFDD